jgi:hypothetical protein
VVPAAALAGGRHEALGWTFAGCNPTLGSLRFGDKVELLRTAGHVGRVIVHDLTDLAGHDDEDA